MRMWRVGCIRRRRHRGSTGQTPRHRPRVPTEAAKKRGLWMPRKRRGGCGEERAGDREHAAVRENGVGAEDDLRDARHDGIY